MRFCLVTAGNISSRPRLVKAADALFAAGHVVRVVALDVQRVHAVADANVMQRRGWSLERIDLRRGSVVGDLQRAASAAGQAVARVVWGRVTNDGSKSRGGVGAAAADRALSRYLGPLTTRAARQPTDVVVAHGLAALPAAARVAARRHAKLGFDSEDFHTGELPCTPEHAVERSLVRDVERRHLSKCDYLTASTSGIADALVQAYGIQRPVVILNSFPTADRSGVETVRSERGAALSLYWFSQVIGGGRGLEDAVEALPLIGRPVQLHLRGLPDRTFVDPLLARARALGVADSIFLWPLAAPDELVKLAAQHDIGLALEPPNTLNHDLCASNKLFVYLLAGLAVAASDTQGQRAVMQRAEGAGFVYGSGDAGALAAGIRGLAASPAELQRARAAAVHAAQTELAWEGQAAALVEYLTSTR